MKSSLLLLVSGFFAIAWSSDSSSPPTAPGESKNVSFVVYVEDSKDDSKFLKGNDIVLNCTVEGKPRTLRIVGHNLMISFNESSGKPFVVHKLTGAQCIAMGSYMCEVDDFQVKEKSFGLYDCGPQLCPGNEVNRTIYIYPGQPLRFDLCVLAYPGLYENMLINDVHIRKKDLSQIWSWDYQNSSFTYHLQLAHNSILEPELGDLRLQIFSAIGEQYVLEQFVTLRAPGPPECPLEVTVKDQGINYVTLSWTPGSDEGYPQRFHAFFSQDNVTWYRYDVIGEQRLANLTGLLRNSSYFFSVVSSNKLRQEIDAFTCDVFQSSTLLDFRGPPECPLEVTVADQGINYVTLSWIPGSDEGYSQRFHAFFSHDNVTWYRYDVIGEQRLVNLTGLQRNSSYSFSVVSSNKLRQEIDAFTCDVFQSSTLLDFRGSTLALAASDEDGNEPGKRLPLMFLMFCLGAVFVAAVWVTVVVLRLRSRKGRRRAHSSENSSVTPDNSKSSEAPLVKDIESSCPSSERESFTD